MSILDNLPHTCSAYVRTRTRDSMGGSRNTYGTAVFEDRACWVQPNGSTGGMEFEKPAINSSYKIYFTEDPELDERHVIVYNGITHLVKSVKEPDASAGLGVLYKVEVEVPPPQGSTP